MEYTGAKCSRKKREVREVIQDNGLKLCAIVESHVHSESLDVICSRTFGRWAWISNHLFSEHGTRIIIAWDLRMLDVMVMESHGQYMNCQVKFV